MTLQSLVPLAHVRSVPRSIEFYKKLGFLEHDIHTPVSESEPVWVWLHSGGAHLMLARARERVDSSEQSVLFYIYCDDVDEFRNRLLDSGVDAGEIQHPFYAPRGEFPVTDPDGYVLMVSHT